MRTIDVGRLLRADPAAVWDALIDVRCWSSWGPSVRSAAIDSGGTGPHRIGPGATGTVRTAVGLTVPFVITGFDPGRRWTWEVAGVAATGHRVEPAGTGRCRAVIEVPAWAPIYGPLCWVALGRLGRVARAEPPPG